MNGYPIDNEQFSEFNQKSADLLMFFEVLKMALDGQIKTPADDVLSHWFKIESMLKAGNLIINDLISIGDKASIEYDINETAKGYAALHGKPLSKAGQI